MEGQPPAGPEKPQWGAPAPAPTPPPAQPDRRNPWPLFAAAALLLLLIAGGAIVALGGGEEEAEAQTVRFQQPTDPGPAPFTRRADVRGPDKVKVGSGPFGGTGSDLVCDRDLLIKSLRARPDRLRAWARVVGIEPTTGAVTRYIRRLRPYTLTRDTRITNHSYVDGQPVAFQSILQAGTAVLVDEDGKPIARCRCGNPLREPIFIEEAKCIFCPASYTPPPPCSDYAECYRRYPHPPPVVIYARPRPREREPEQESPPQDDIRDSPATAAFDPQSGTTEDTYTLYVSSFRPNSTVRVTLTRPDGVSETYAIQTDGNGTGNYTFPRVSNPPPGTYTARASDGQRTATATTRVSAGSEPQQPSAVQPSQDRNNNGIRDTEEGGNPPGPEVGGGTDCNNPQSQDEVELCGGTSTLEGE